MSVAAALEAACDQAQTYADELHRVRCELIAAQAEIERLHKERRDLKIILSGNMPMTALDYLTINDFPHTHH